MNRPVSLALLLLLAGAAGAATVLSVGDDETLRVAASRRVVKILTSCTGVAGAAGSLLRSPAGQWVGQQRPSG